MILEDNPDIQTVNNAYDYFKDVNGYEPSDEELADFMEEYYDHLEELALSEDE